MTRLVAIFLVAVLAGCATAPQAPVSLSSEAANGRVAVAMTPLPKVDTHFPGAGCLLCIAAASLANSSLTSHTQTLPYEDLPKLKNQIAELLKKKGATTIVIDEPLNVAALPDFSGAKAPNVAAKDFSALQQKYQVDKLVVIDVTMLGVIRPYSAYIPASDPKGVFQATGYMLNLRSNVYEWYLPVSIMKSSDQAWDEPPKFPGVTNAYFQSLELGKDSFTKPFAQ